MVRLTELPMWMRGKAGYAVPREVVATVLEKEEQTLVRDWPNPRGSTYVARRTFQCRLGRDELVDRSDRHPFFIRVESLHV